MHPLQENAEGKKKTKKLFFLGTLETFQALVVSQKWKKLFLVPLTFTCQSRMDADFASEIRESRFVAQIRVKIERRKNQIPYL